jgi:hypothetical protein
MCAAWVLLLAIAGSPRLAADWLPYQASYAAYKNGKLIGELTITLQRQGDQLSISSEGNGTRGLARFLRARDSESVSGKLLQGRFFPDQYSHHTRVASIDNVWSAAFDWQNGTVNITSGKDTLALDMGPGGALDALSLQLEMQRRLRDHDPDLRFALVAEDMIKERVFERSPAEQLQTSLGCIATIPVERGQIGTNHYTKAWLAPELEFVMVQREDVKTHGDHIELRITRLLRQQEETRFGTSCGPQVD